jgi:hypothetical protein
MVHRRTLSAVWQLAWALTAYHSLHGLLGEDFHVWLEAECLADIFPNPIVDALVHRYLGTHASGPGSSKRNRNASIAP